MYIFSNTTKKFKILQTEHNLIKVHTFNQKIKGLNYDLKMLLI